MKYTPGARRLSALHKEFEKKRKPVHMTQDGVAKFQKEYDDLVAERPTAVEHLKKARELGDLSENGYYKASRARLSYIDSRLLHLSGLLKTVNVITSSQNTTIGLGNTVILDSDGVKKTYMIVGRFEANPSEGKISDVSPLGKLLLGKQLGDSVEIIVPAGKKVYTVEEIQ
jgi:transcription elongation factor GreA